MAGRPRRLRRGPAAIAPMLAAALPEAAAPRTAAVMAEVGGWTAWGAKVARCTRAMGRPRTPAGSMPRRPTSTAMVKAEKASTIRTATIWEVAAAGDGAAVAAAARPARK